MKAQSAARINPYLSESMINSARFVDAARQSRAPSRASSGRSGSRLFTEGADDLALIIGHQSQATGNGFIPEGPGSVMQHPMTLQPQRPRLPRRLGQGQADQLGNLGIAAFFIQKPQPLLIRARGRGLLGDGAPAAQGKQNKGKENTAHGASVARQA